MNSHVQNRIGNQLWAQWIGVLLCSTSTISLLVGCAASAQTDITGMPISTITPVTPTTIVWQPFTKGWIAYAEGATCVYAFNTQTMAIVLDPNAKADISANYAYCIEANVSGTHNTATTPSTHSDQPETLSAIEITMDPFIAQVWNHQVVVREALGTASGPAQRYPRLLPTPINTNSGGGPWELPMINLPNGQALYCGVRSATSGRCSVHT